MPGSQRTSLVEGEFRYRVSVTLHFRRQDAPKLWELARHHWPKDAYGDPGMFPKAAKCAEDGSPLLLQSLTVPEMQEIAAFFPRFGIPVRIEELRI